MDIFHGVIADFKRYWDVGRRAFSLRMVMCRRQMSFFSQKTIICLLFQCQKTLTGLHAIVYLLFFDWMRTSPGNRIMSRMYCYFYHIRSIPISRMAVGGKPYQCDISVRTSLAVTCRCGNLIRRALRSDLLRHCCQFTTEKNSTQDFRVNVVMTPDLPISVMRSAAFCHFFEDPVDDTVSRIPAFSRGCRYFSNVFAESKLSRSFSFRAISLHACISFSNAESAVTSVH